MKKYLLLLLVVVFTAPAWAQSDTDYIEMERTVLKTERKAVVTDAMQFTDEEAKVFWPLYNEYTAEVYKIQTENLDIILDYAENYETMSDEKADELMLRTFKVTDELVKLKKAYYKKFKKILASGRVVRFFQIDNKINALISAEMALEIPLVEISK